MGVLIISFQIKAKQKELVIAADIWCPVNCQPNSEAPGYMIEIFNRIFNKYEISTKYQVLPWTRTLIEVQKGNVHAVVGVFKRNDGVFIYPDEELGIMTNSFYTRKNSPWVYQGIDSLKTKNLLAIKDYQYGKLIDSYISNKANSNHVSLMSGDTDIVKRAMLMMLTKRVDVFIESDIIFNFVAMKENLTNKFKYSGRASPPIKSYIAFASNFSEANHYAKILSDEVVKMRASGELQSILAKYGIKDWKQ